jgi:hypothetical protein
MRLISIGLLISVAPSILTRFMHVDMPDFLNGFIRGIGLGLMLLVLMHPKFRQKREEQQA